MKINLKLLVLSLFIVVGSLRCSDSKEIEEVGSKSDMVGNMSFYTDHTDISIKETDEKGTFTFKTKKAFDKDITIALSIKGEGASLSADKITLSAGMFEVTGEVVFNKDMFDGADNNLIEVVVSASSNEVSLDKMTITYDVHKYIYGAPEVSITVDTANVEVFYENVPVKVTVKSDIALPADATFTLSTDGGKEGVDFNFPDKTVTIKKGETEGSTVLTLLKASFIDGNLENEQGQPGDKAMNIGVKMKTSAAVNLSKSTVIINALGGFFTKTYCLPHITFLTSHYMQTFTIGDYTLNPPHLTTENHYYADLRNSLNTPTGKIEVPTGTSGLSFVTVSNPNGGTTNCIAVAWIDWNQNGDFGDDGEFVANIPYTASVANNGAVHSTNLTIPSFVKIGTSTVMRIGIIEKNNETMTKSNGCGNASQGDVLDVRIHVIKGAEPVTFTGNLANDDITVHEDDIVKTITATLAKPAEVAVDIKVSVKGVDENNYVLKDKVITIPMNGTSASTTLTFKKSAYKIALQKDTYEVELIPGSKYKSTAGSGTKARYNVKGEGTAPTLSVETTQTEVVNVPESGDKTATFQVKLSEKNTAGATDVQLNLDSKYSDMATLSTNSVRFNAGETTPKDITITFKSTYFMYNDVSETIPVSISTTTENVFINSLKNRVSFSVKGIEKRPMLISMSDNVEDPSNRIIDVTTGEKTATCAVWFYAPTGTVLDKTIKMSVSLEKSGFSGEVYISQNQWGDFVPYTGPITITMEAGIDGSTNRYYIKVPQGSVNSGTTDGNINVKVQTTAGNVKFSNSGKNNIEFDLKVVRD